MAIYDRVMTKFVALELTANLIHFYEPLFGRFSEIAERQDLRVADRCCLMSRGSRGFPGPAAYRSDLAP